MTQRSSSADKRIDNMPEKLTAHAIRRLRPCHHCEGIGDGNLMIHGSSGHDGGWLFHTACYIKSFGFDAALRHLPASELGKFRLCDLTPAQMQKLIQVWKRAQ